MILAGGKGSRLAPYTTVLPKPLMPIGDRAILDVVVRQLARRLLRLTIAVGYLAHLIEAVFGNGAATTSDRLPARRTSRSAPPGRSRRSRGSTTPFLALNGDVLTTLDYREFFESHWRAGNAMTIATHGRVGPGQVRRAGGGGERGARPARDRLPREARDPVHGEHGRLRAVARRSRAVPKGRFDIPDLVLALLDAGVPVGSYPFDGYWLDIGRHDDYEQALGDYETILPRLLSGAAP